MRRHSGDLTSDASIFLIKLKSIFIGILAVASLFLGFVFGIIKQSWLIGIGGLVLFIILKYYADYVHFKYKRRCGHIIHYG